MKIIDIDKAQYRRKLNYVIIGFIITLASLSLVFGSVLIALFAQQTPIIAGETVQPSNFKYNFLGVVMALLACAAILHSIKNKAYFKEIYYVWQMKQIQNAIYRKLSKIKKAAFDQSDSRESEIEVSERQTVEVNQTDKSLNALIILNYYYASLKHIYVLDDNTLTLSSLNKDIEKLSDILTKKNITINTDQFDQSMLSYY